MFFSNNTTQKSKQILPAKFTIHCTNNLINEIPEVAGNFDIKFKIGAGTFSTVYAAFLNQARAWFLKVEPVRIVSMCVYVCVCVRPRGY